MRNYVKIPAIKVMPDSDTLKKKLTDSDFKNYIFHFILLFYSETKTEDVWENINVLEASSKNKNREENIVEMIDVWLRSSTKYARSSQSNNANFIFNFEPKSSGKIKGHYDIKINHSNWKKGNKIVYFVFECKCLDLSKNSKTHSIPEYVYNKSKQDGGVYRFLLDDKYSKEQSFGGMIGFVLGGSTKDYKKRIQKTLVDLKDNIDFGHLVENGIIDNSIEENEFTFDSIHTRANGQKITLHHILFDFTKKN